MPFTIDETYLYIYKDKGQSYHTQTLSYQKVGQDPLPSRSTEQTTTAPAEVITGSGD